MNMRRYDEFKEDCSDVEWTNYVIIAKTQKDKEKLMDAFRHIHDSDVDTGFVTINELAHNYLTPNAILVSKIFYVMIKWIQNRTRKT